MRYRGWLPLLAAVTITISACSGGDAVQANNGGQFRFVAATPSGDLIAAEERGVAPAFGGTLLDGEDFESAQLDGQIVVINFWGSWCPPCRVETPQFQDVYADVRDQGVAFLGINVKDGDEQARAFIAANGITFPSVFDPRGEISLIFRDFPPSAIPSTLLLDRSGRVAAIYLGAVAEEDLRAVLDRLLEEA